MRGLVSLLLAPLLGLALWGTAELGGLYWELFETRSWMPLPATLVHCELVRPKEGVGRFAGSRQPLLARWPLASRLEVEYLYTLNGTEYTGDQAGLWDASILGFGQQHRFELLAASAASRRLIPCYINPGRPRQAVLFREIHWDEFLVFFIPTSVVGGSTLGVICGYLVVVTLRWPRAARAYKEWRMQQDYFYGKRPTGYSGYPTYVSIPLCLALWWYAVAGPYAAISLMAVPRHPGVIVTAVSVLVLGLPLIYWTGQNYSRYDLRQFLRSQGRANGGAGTATPPAAAADATPPAPDGQS